MNNKILKVVGLLIITVILVFASGCVEAGKLKTESRKIELEGADFIRGEFKICAGELKIARDADSLMNADFAYNVNDWRPELNYGVNGSEGRLIIQQLRCDGGISMNDLRNEWDIHLNSGVPLALSIDMGTGKGDLRLGSLNLTDLDIRMGAGEARVDLSSSQTLSNFSMAMGAGNAVVDMTGAWKRNLSARIDGGVGRLTLRLPRDAGVRVNAHGGLGKINADGLKKDGGSYVNEAFGRSDVTLNINIEAGVGEIRLEMGE